MLSRYNLVCISVFVRFFQQFRLLFYRQVEFGSTAKFFQSFKAVNGFACRQIQIVVVKRQRIKRARFVKQFFVTEGCRDTVGIVYNFALTHVDVVFADKFFC